MSQPDLARQLRAARPAAPAELRERVRLVAAQAATPRRQIVTWRRAVLAAAVVGASIAAGVIATRPTHRALQNDHRALVPLKAISHGSGATDQFSTTGAPVAPSPSQKRLQNYSASLDVRSTSRRPAPSIHIPGAREPPRCAGRPKPQDAMSSAAM